MSIIEAITTALKIVFEVLNYWIERDQEKRKQRQQAIKEAQDAYKAGDKASVIRAFDRLHNA